MTTAQLLPCPSCARHARATDAACPFCGVPLPEAFRSAPRPEPHSARLTRAALFALGSGTLALAPGCSGGSSPPAGPEDATANFAPPYGAFFPDTGAGFIDVSDSGGNVDAQPIGAPCSTSDECGTGASCLFPVGGGCTTQGHCEVQDSCTPQSTPVVLCVCGIGGLLELQCAPSHGYGEQTTMGACPAPDAAGPDAAGLDGSTDASTADAMDAAVTGDTE